MSGQITSNGPRKVYGNYCFPTKSAINGFDMLDLSVMIPAWINFPEKLTYHDSLETAARRLGPHLIRIISHFPTTTAPTAKKVQKPFVVSLDFPTAVPFRRPIFSLRAALEGHGRPYLN